MTAAPPVEAGVGFPRGADGRRSTQATGRAVVADAARAVDAGLATSVERERDWRSGYLPAVRTLTEATTVGAAAAYAIAQAGLDSVHRRFVVARPVGDEPLADALARPGAALTATTLDGEGAGGPQQLSVPYRGRRLTGGDLDRRLDAWVADGVTEPSFAEALHRVAAHPEWLDLRDLTVVVLGAGAEMAPYVSLVRWGAHVVAVDLPGPAWDRLLAEARRSPGRVTAPGLRGAPGPGVDLLTQSPELLAWLLGLGVPELTLGHYVYADGALHVRASVAIDAVTAALLREQPRTSLAFLATPTDAFVVPEDVVEDSRRRREAAGPWARGTRVLTAGRAFQPAYGRLFATEDGGLVGVNDSLVPQQGANYALAKRVQRWRGEVARRDGVRVSLNVAPATRTRSVTRNRLLAAAYAGAHRFGVEVFDPSTASTVMAALLVHDLRHPGALADPATPLAHPAELTWENACHSGLWRNAWSARSVLGLAVAAGLLPRGR